MNRRRRLAVLAALAALTFAGCTETPSVVRTPTTAGSTADDPGLGAPNPDLEAVKKTAGIAGCPATDAQATPVADGLPDLTVPCLGGGRSVDLAGLRGRPTVINVWAQWCTPCRDEAPVLAEVTRANTSDVAFLGVDHADPAPDLAVQFAVDAGWTYPQLYDPDLVFRTELQVSAMPVTLFVRADGSIAGRHPGQFRSADDLRQTTQRYLGVTP